MREAKAGNAGPESASGVAKGLDAAARKETRRTAVDEFQDVNACVLNHTQAGPATAVTSSMNEWLVDGNQIEGQCPLSPVPCIVQPRVVGAAKSGGTVEVVEGSI